MQRTYSLGVYCGVKTALPGPHAPDAACCLGPQSDTPTQLEDVNEIISKECDLGDTPSSGSVQRRAVVSDAAPHPPPPPASPRRAQAGNKVSAM